MNRLTTDKPNGSYENALNLFYGKDWEVWVRGGGAAPEYPDVRLIDYIRDIARRHKLAFTPEADDMTFAEETNDALLDGTDTLEGVVGMLHTAGWVCATLRARLAAYEDTGLTPEEVVNLKAEAALGRADDGQ